MSEPVAAGAGTPLLTSAEREVIRDLGLIYQRFRELAGNSAATRGDDLREVVLHVHALQRIIMAQAAAREFPGELRLLGGILHTGEVP